MSLPGLEPGIFCSVGRRVIHCATSPTDSSALLFYNEATDLFWSALLIGCCNILRRAAAHFFVYTLIIFAFLYYEICKDGLFEDEACNALIINCKLFSGWVGRMCFPDLTTVLVRESVFAPTKDLDNNVLDTKKCIFCPFPIETWVQASFFLLASVRSLFDCCQLTEEFGLYFIN